MVDPRLKRLVRINWRRRGGDRRAWRFEALIWRRMLAQAIEAAAGLR